MVTHGSSLISHKTMFTTLFISLLIELHGSILCSSCTVAVKLINWSFTISCNELS